MVPSLRERLVQLWNPEDPLDSLWRILASRHVTALLLACLAILVGIVVLVPQRPAEALSDPTANRLWMESLGQRLGSTANWLTGLRLVDVRQSMLLRAVLGLLAFNLLLCFVDLVHPIHQVSGSLLALRVEREEDAGPQMGSVSRATLVVTDGEPERGQVLTERVGQLLKDQRYRVVERDDGDWLYADRFVSFAAVLCLGLLLAITGLVLSERTAWWEENVTLGPGQVRPLGHGTDLAIRADVVELGSESNARFHTRVTLLREGEAIATGRLPDRFPALYDGLLFDAVSTEPALLVQAQDSTGANLPLQTPETGTTQFTQVALRFREQEAEESPQYLVVLDLRRGRQVGRQFEQRANERYVIVPSRNLSLRLVYEPTPSQPGHYRLEAYRGNESSPFTEHELDSSRSVEIAGDFYTLQPQRYAVIRFGQDYGLGILLVGAIVTVLGIVLSIWRRRRQLWVWSEGTDEQVLVHLASTGKAVPWFGSLVTEIGTALNLEQTPGYR
jgi:hypothetical protein